MQYSEVSSGDQPYKYGITVHYFLDCLCIHHEGFCDG
jgi:hypothetical protein